MMRGNTIDSPVSPATQIGAVAEPSVPSVRKRRNVYMLSLGMGAFLTLCAWGAITGYFGSIMGFVAAIQGETVFVTPVHVDLGSVPSGSDRSAIVRLTNVTNRSIRVVGAEPSCSCVTMLNNLPVALPPRGSVDISLTMKVHEQEQEATVDFFVDDGSTESRRVTIKAVGVKK